MDRIIKSLKTAMLVGFFVDVFVVIVFITPTLRILVFGENTLFHSPQYEWAMRMIASIGLAWTVLLLWASRKPLERKDVLFFTVFPLMFGAYTSMLYGYLTAALSVRLLVLFTIITFVHCPWFLCLWIKARKFEREI